MTQIRYDTSDSSDYGLWLFDNTVRVLNSESLDSDDYGPTNTCGVWHAVQLLAESKIHAGKQLLANWVMLVHAGSQLVELDSFEGTSCTVEATRAKVSFVFGALHLHIMPGRTVLRPRRF